LKKGWAKPTIIVRQQDAFTAAGRLVISTRLEFHFLLSLLSTSIKVVYTIFYIKVFNLEKPLFLIGMRNDRG